MARIRSIKPEFFSHEDLASKSPHARLLAIGLLTLADCEGRLRWVPMQVHSQVFPWEASVNIETLLGELLDVTYVLHYEVDGKRYVVIPNFRKHQRLSGKEAGYKSLLPAPPDVIKKPRVLRAKVGETPGKQSDASLGSGGNPLGTGEQGNIGTGEHRNIGTGEHRNSNAAEAVSPAEVLKLWNLKMSQSCRMTHKRQMSAIARLKDPDWRAIYSEAIDKSSLSDFCNGRSPGGTWVADFEWFLKPDSATKLIEGKYDNREEVHRSNGHQQKTFAQMRVDNSKAAIERFGQMDIGSLGRAIAND